MNVGLFVILYVLIGGSLLIFGTPFVASFGIGGIIASIVIGIAWLVFGIFAWEKWGNKE